VTKASYKFVYILTWLLFLLLIIAETIYLNDKGVVFEKLTLSTILLGSLGLFLFVKFLPNRFDNKYWRVSLSSLKVVLVLLLLILLISEALIASFSGLTFGIEVFHHFEWQTIILGVKEYFLELSIFLIFILLSAATVTKSLIFKTVKHQSILFLIGVVLLMLFVESTIVSRFYSGLLEYNQPRSISEFEAAHINSGLLEYNQPRSIPESEAAGVNMFNHLGIQAPTVTKIGISANPGNNKNIIVVYLESFSHFFTNSKRFPDLTPNINRLKEQHGELKNYYSNAGFTMDGLISSNCGFIPNMALGNNSLFGAVKPYFFFPCATDVLAKAGYYQEFIGGAEKRFANKEAFLLEHGFNKVWGWEDFEGGKRFRPEGAKSWWGLHDEDLFEFAIQRITDLGAKEPFHLSLLTLSTHPNGFSSPSCRKYKDIDDRYLNAIYCLDQLLGKFVTDIQKKGLLENTLLVITADHGAFNSSLIKGLFGKEVNHRRILGLVLDGKNNNIEEPVALYDLGPAILKMLDIEHNVKFIFGSGFYDNSQERTLFSKRGIYQDGKWSQVKKKKRCQSNNSTFLEPPIDFCELRHILKVVHGFTDSFGLSFGIDYSSESNLNISFTAAGKNIKDILLDGKSLVESFRRSGFVLKLKQLAWREGSIFMVFFEPQDQKMFNLFNFLIKENSLGRIDQIINSNEGMPFVIFSNKFDESLKLVEIIKEKHRLSCLSAYFCMSGEALTEVLKVQEQGDQINIRFFHSITI